MMKKNWILLAAGTLVILSALTIGINRKTAENQASITEPPNIADGAGKSGDEYEEEKVAPKSEQASSSSQRTFESSPSASESTQKKAVSSERAFNDFDLARAQITRMVSGVDTNKLSRKLARQLQLDATQASELKEFLDAQVAANAERIGLSIGGQKGIDMLLENENLNEFMENLLTGDQQTNWEAHQAQQIDRKADTRALNELIEFNSITHIRPEQRQALYEHFYEKSLSAITSPPGDNTPNAQENSGNLIEDRVNEFANILDERQQQDYRDELISLYGTASTDED